MSDTALTTLANGYLQAWGHFNSATVGSERAEAMFVPLFETLGWLDMMLLRPEVELAMPPTPHLAFLFVRGCVNGWSEAIEFRTDVIRQHPLGLAGTSKSVYTYAAVVADWCWLPAGELEAFGRPEGEAAYEELLAGRQAREGLGEFADLARQLTRRPSRS